MATPAVRASWPMRMEDMGDLLAGPTVCSLDLSPESRATTAAPSPACGGGRRAASRAAGRLLPPPAGEGWDGGTLRRGAACPRDLRPAAPTPALPRTRG